MKKIGWILLLCLCGYLLTGCNPSGTPASNSGNTANTNTATKPAAAAPTADALVALDKQANEAYFKGDGKFFQDFLSDKFVMGVGSGNWAGKSSIVDMISKVKCDMKDFNLSDQQMSKIDDDTYALTYKATFNGTCTADGKSIPSPSPVRAATLWIRNGDKWQAVFHGENPIVDPKNPPKAPAKPAEPKKDDKAPAAPAPALPAKSANTEAVAAVEKSGWEAWRDKDAKKLDSIIAKNIAIVSADGSSNNDRAGIIKYWSEMACKDVKNVDVKNPYGVSLGANTEMLAFTGTADGTCDGQKNGSQPSISVYIKEDGAWKLAFAFGGASDSM
ncbi:MAG: nuclear transport factor 2 family protein [Acidobacteria bacterium]|nr:nuclear transport factor 2 family protein [Acidobacteriota bacterium]